MSWVLSNLCDFNALFQPKITKGYSPSARFPFMHEHLYKVEKQQ